MRKLFVVMSLGLLSLIKAQTWNTEDQYIQKFAPYAVEEMEKYKIPASIKLAQGLLETGGGQSRLALQGKNHFGIKCKEDWTGKTMKHTDDAPNECFRVYDDPKQSYEDHSIFLATRKYYTNLFKLDIKDYKAWAHGLKKAGYATNPRYAYILISKIEKYKLYEFDNTSSKEVYYAILKKYPDLNKDSEFMAKVDQSKGIIKTPAIVAQPTYKPSSVVKQSQNNDFLDEKTKANLLKRILVKNHPNNGKKFFVAPADTDVAFISKKFGISETKLMRYNELSSSEIKRNAIIFLDQKSSKGNVAVYKAIDGESMYDISQRFGIQLKKLYSKNRMDYGQEPSVGQLIYLQKKKPRS